jgi:hypothetical protein
MTENGAEVKRTILKVNGVFIPDPSEMQWGEQSVSDSNAGRDMNGDMHVNLINRKRKLELKWSGIDFATTSEVIKAVEPETFQVTFFDFKENKNVTKTFYVGDRTSTVKSFVSGYRRCDVAFNIIEV